MLPSEVLAIAAHLHVLLRRKTGRVTDTEWMAKNTEYATEIVRFARASALKDGHADLGEWADKLDSALGNTATSAKRPGPASSVPEAGAPEATRYVRGIR
jgi:hypothetical protein